MSTYEDTKKKHNGWLIFFVAFAVKKMALSHKHL